MKTKFFGVFLIIIFSVFPLFAHKLNILAFAENDTLTVNSYFADGTPCRDCSFQVLDADGKVFAEGKLDEKGEFFRAGETPTELNIIVDAGMGHKAQQSITASADTSMAYEEPSSSVDSALLSRLIRQELSKQTAEIKAEIEKGRSRLDMIIAGVGYILGIFGLAVLVKKR